MATTNQVHTLETSSGSIQQLEATLSNALKTIREQGESGLCAALPEIKRASLMASMLAGKENNFPTEMTDLDPRMVEKLTERLSEDSWSADPSAEDVKNFLLNLVKATQTTGLINRRDLRYSAIEHNVCPKDTRTIAWLIEHLTKLDLIRRIIKSSNNSSYCITFRAATEERQDSILDLQSVQFNRYHSR